MYSFLQVQYCFYKDKKLYFLFDICKNSIELDEKNVLCK